MPSPQEAAAALMGLDPVSTAVPQASEQYPGMVQGTAAALQGIAALPQRTFEASEELRNTGQYNPAPAMETAMMLAGGGMPMAEAGAAGIFGGNLARGANRVNLFRAVNRDMEPWNVNSPADILKETGWFKGADSKWRFEIPDKEAGLKIDPSEESNRRFALTLGDYLHHPELFQQYPNLKNIQVRPRPGDWGYYHFPQHGVPEHLELATEYPQGLGSEQNKLQHLLHETQHAIQARERFDPGSNPAIDPNYLKNRGEVEARNVENRLGMSNKLYPWMTQDFPYHMQTKAPIQHGYVITPGGKTGTPWGGPLPKKGNIHDSEHGQVFDVQQKGRWPQYLASPTKGDPMKFPSYKQAIDWLKNAKS